MEQLLLHLFGDYVVQNNWMATWKVRRAWPAFVHALTYTLPFLLLTQSFAALAVIGGTHYIIDRYSLGKYVMQAKGSQPTGTYIFPDGFVWKYYEGVQFVVYVATDNTFHLIINYLALRYLA